MTEENRVYIESLKFWIQEQKHRIEQNNLNDEFGIKNQIIEEKLRAIRFDQNQLTLQSIKEAEEEIKRYK